MLQGIALLTCKLVVKHSAIKKIFWSSTTSWWNALTTVAPVTYNYNEFVSSTKWHDLSQCYDTGIQTHAEFAKEFDHIRCTDLNGKGIQRNVKSWISLLILNGKTQCVVLDVAYSSRCPVLSGVPQSTVLGPILFSIYINNLAEIIIPGVHRILWTSRTCL